MPCRDIVRRGLSKIVCCIDAQLSCYNLYNTTTINALVHVSFIAYGTSACMAYITYMACMPGMTGMTGMTVMAWVRSSSGITHICANPMIFYQIPIKIFSPMWIWIADLRKGVFMTVRMLVINCHISTKRSNWTDIRNSPRPSNFVQYWMLLLKSNKLLLTLKLILV